MRLSVFSRSYMFRRSKSQESAGSKTSWKNARVKSTDVLRSEFLFLDETSASKVHQAQAIPGTITLRHALCQCLMDDMTQPEALSWVTSRML
jgi:hypothetical protein